METIPAPDAASAETPTGAAPEKKEGWRETLRFLLFLFVFTIVFRSFFLAPFMIPSGSMLPRMMIGDYLFVAKWPYGYSRFSFPFGLASFEGRVWQAQPGRGDIVVFRYPDGGDEDYVKRLIGLPGDTIQMRGGTLYLNGEAVPRVRIADYLMRESPNSPCRDVSGTPRVVEQDGARYCAYPRYRETLPGGRAYEVLDQTEGPGDDTETFVVPEGHYFMMGDNRDDSLDSRYALSQEGVGLLPADHVIGKALVTFFSTDGTASWALPWTWVSAARWERIGATY